MARHVGMDELVEYWTVLDEEQELLAGKRGATRLGFALLLKYYTRHGRFPRGRAEFADEVVAFVARQVNVPATEIAFYEWSGRTIEYHRKQIRTHLGFRVCGVADADKLTDWLAANVAHAERNTDRVRAELLTHCFAERIEPPTAERLTRMVRSALSRAEEAWFTTIEARALAPSCARGYWTWPSSTRTATLTMRRRRSRCWAWSRRCRATSVWNRCCGRSASWRRSARSACPRPCSPRWHRRCWSPGASGRRWSRPRICAGARPPRR